MKIVLAIFASKRYWQDKNELQSIYHDIKVKLNVYDDCYLINSEQDVNKIEVHNNGTLIVLPISGGVQPLIIKLAEKFSNVCLYAGYINGNFDKKITDKMLINNSAPTVMDTWAVLKRMDNNSIICLNESQLNKVVRVINAYNRVKHSKLLLIGDIEPWVISVNRNIKVYKDKLGVDIIKLSYEEIEENYFNVNKEQALDLYNKYKENADKVIEPTNRDILNACRFGIALRRIIEKYNADGVALACFDLIKKIGITSCIGVSYINDSTNYIAACEGDIESAITMLIMKKISGSCTWMANPNIQGDKSVNFVHCTAPIDIMGKKCSYILRNHHETHLGVSPQVNIPKNVLLTACRLSDNANKITFQTAISTNGEYEPSCRTQIRVKFNDFDKYINTALGCHQVFVFDNITYELELISKLFNLEIVY